MLQIFMIIATHESIPLISEAVTYLLPHYTFFGQIYDFLPMLSSSSTAKHIPSCAHVTHRSIRVRASPQPKTPPLKALATHKKQVSLSKKAFTASLKDFASSFKTFKLVDSTPPPSLTSTDGKLLAD